MQISQIPFTGYFQTISRALDAIGAGQVLSRQSRVLIKPNLVNDAPPPVTTPVACCRAIIDYLQAHCAAELVIAEGTGMPGVETHAVFETLGYGRLARQYRIRLVDLNHEPSVRLENPDCKRFNPIWLPEIAFSHFIISVPVLKAHSLAEITGSLKNMLGFAPPQQYGGGCGSWKKAAFHQRIQGSIRELNRYRTPDLTVLDATVGLAEYHLGGRRCDPPVNQILAGWDPLAVDRRAAELLGLDWQGIPHLNPATRR